MGENQLHDTVRTVGRVSDDGQRGAKSSFAPTGTGALVVQTMLTVLTQRVKEQVHVHEPVNPIWPRAGA
jgi:hypothetical protein